LQIIKVTKIFFKFDLNSDKNNDKELKIISFRKIIISYSGVIKLSGMKLIEDDIYYFIIKSGNENKINIFKNFQECKNFITLDDNIINFIILENGNLVIYLPYKLIIYKFSKDIFNFEKKIDLSYNKNNYQVLNYLCQNNFSVLIHDKVKKTINLKFYIYPDYQDTSLLLEKSQIEPINGTAKQVYKWIIIGIDYYANNLYKIFIYDITAEKIKCITMKKRQTYYDSVKIYEIGFNKVLVSFQRYGLIINLETKQIETKIKLGAIQCLYRIGNYLLSSSNDYIYQFDIKKGKIYNKIKLLYGAYQFTFLNLIDIGNNYFCGISQNKIGYLFKYK